MSQNSLHPSSGLDPSWIRPTSNLRSILQMIVRMALCRLAIKIASFDKAKTGRPSRSTAVLFPQIQRQRRPAYFLSPLLQSSAPSESSLFLTWSMVAPGKVSITACTKW